MPICRLVRITCYEQEDWTGDDHPYIKINGEVVWGPKSMDTRQTREIRRDYQFLHRAKVALYEDDDWDGDDFLGEHVIIRADVGKGLQEFPFKEDDANYSIWIEVCAGSGR